MFEPEPSPSGNRDEAGVPKRPMSTARCLLYTILGWTVLLFACCGGLAFFIGHFETLGQFELPGNRVLTIYAEPALHYEPPGYIYFELSENGRVVVPRRRFMGAGSERKPSGTFDVVLSDDESVVAVTLG